MDEILPQLVTGLSIASVLLLVALGLAVIYGVTGVINMAHGELVMLGAYGAWALQTTFGLGLLECLPVIVLASALLGWVVERLIIRHLYARPLDTILATWGLGIVLQQAVRLSAGGELRYVAGPEYLVGTFSLGGAVVPLYRAFILALTVLLVAVTWHLLFRTRFGMQVRAITQSREIASCFGINSGRVFSLTFAYGAGLAGLAGALVAPMKSVSPEMGTTYVVDAFMVVVLGGVESLLGTVASSIIIGEASGIIAYLHNDTIAKAAVLLGIIILIRFRPQGLFAAKARA